MSDNNPSLINGSQGTPDDGDNLNPVSPPATDAGGDDGGQLAYLDQYKNEENGQFFGRYPSIEAVFQSFKEQDSELGRLRRQNSPEIPESDNDYKFTVGEGDDAQEFSPENDELLAKFAPVFRELKIPVENANKLFEVWASYQQSQGPDLAAERQKLGDEADNIIGAVETWVTKRGSEGALRLAQLAGSDAELLKEFYGLINATGEQRIPGNTGLSSGGKSRDQLMQDAFAYEEKHKATIRTNPKQQAEYQRLMDIAMSTKK